MTTIRGSWVDGDRRMTRNPEVTDYDRELAAKHMDAWYEAGFRDLSDLGDESFAEVIAQARHDQHRASLAAAFRLAQRRKDLCVEQLGEARNLDLSEDAHGWHVGAAECATVRDEIQRLRITSPPTPETKKEEHPDGCACERCCVTEGDYA